MSSPFSSSITRAVLVFVLILAVGFLGIWLVAKQRPGFAQSSSITLTEDGFSPAELVVRAGQRIVFKNLSEHDFWPASDLHPTHALYAEFDAKGAMPPGGEWAFTFTREGVWRYHDHQAPGLRGVVRVTGEAGETARTALDCGTVPDAEKFACWNEVVVALLQQKGVTPALQQIRQWYATEPRFASECHDYLHKAGEAAFATRFVPEELGPEASYCGYGFFHGYMERTLAETGSTQTAVEFCAAVVRSQPRNIGDACYHGFGHGLFTQAAETMTDKTGPEIVGKALVGCVAMAGEQQETAARCSSGVFMEYAVSSTEGLYGLSVDARNPFGLCKSQVVIFQSDCYRQLQILVSSITGDDIRAGLRFSEAIPDTGLARTMTETYMGGAPDIKSASNVSRAAAICAQVQSRISQACVNGIALAYLLKGVPGNEGESAVAFCQSAAVPAPQQHVCVAFVVNYVQHSYAPERLKQFCTATKECVVE
jgi:plastocyanin